MIKTFALATLALCLAGAPTLAELRKLAPEKLPGGMGVMADDMLAGLAAGIIAAGVQYTRVI